MKQQKPRILFIDIETFANHSRTWPGMYDLNVIKITKPWEIASFAYSWDQEKKIHCETRAGQRSDCALMRKLRNVLNEADVVVVQNGKKFDIKSWNTRMWKHEIPPYSPFKVVDTLVEGKRHFKLNSYSLDSMAEFLGVGRKLKHRGFDMWEECEANDPKAWREMVRYNKHDVFLMRGVYYKMLAWIDKHPNLATMAGKPNACPKCLTIGSLHSKGFNYTQVAKFAKYHCQVCKGWCSARVAEKQLKSTFVNLK